jgi:hypothetical protein
VVEVALKVALKREEHAVAEVLVVWQQMLDLRRDLLQQQRLTSAETERPRGDLRAAELASERYRGEIADLRRQLEAKTSAVNIMDARLAATEQQQQQQQQQTEARWVAESQPDVTKVAAAVAVMMDARRAASKSIGTQTPARISKAGKEYAVTGRHTGPRLKQSVDLPAPCTMRTQSIVLAQRLRAYPGVEDESVEFLTEVQTLYAGEDQVYNTDLLRFPLKVTRACAATIDELWDPNADRTRLRAERVVAKLVKDVKVATADSRLVKRQEAHKQRVKAARFEQREHFRARHLPHSRGAPASKKAAKRMANAHAADKKKAKKRRL